MCSFPRLWELPLHSYMFAGYREVFMQPTLLDNLDLVWSWDPTLQRKRWWDQLDSAVCKTFSSTGEAREEMSPSEKHCASRSNSFNSCLYCILCAENKTFTLLQRGMSKDSENCVKSCDWGGNFLSEVTWDGGYRAFMVDACNLISLKCMNEHEMYCSEFSFENQVRLSLLVWPTLDFLYQALKHFVGSTQLGESELQILLWENPGGAVSESNSAKYLRWILMFRAFSRIAVLNFS